MCQKKKRPDEVRPLAHGSMMRELLGPWATHVIAKTNRSCTRVKSHRSTDEGYDVSRVCRTWMLHDENLGTGQGVNGRIIPIGINPRIVHKW